MVIIMSYWKVNDKNNVLLREESWRDLEELYKEGKVRSIGVSNFNISHLESLLESCEVIPHVNQVRIFLVYMILFIKTTSPSITCRRRAPMS